jgi:hypothetical protein
MPTAPDATAPSNAALRISLKIVLGAAVVDAVFLVGLGVALAAGSGAAVRVLGALYGFGFVYLLYLAAKGAMDERWGWSYLVLVAVTLGPVGAIVGERRMQARLSSAAPPETPDGRPTRKEARRTATERRRADR